MRKGGSESQTHRDPSHQLHLHYVSCRASNEDAGPWGSCPRLLPTLITPAPPQDLVGYTGHNHWDREQPESNAGAWTSISLETQVTQVGAGPADAGRGPRDSSCPPSSGSWLSVPELRQQSPQQAPWLGAMTALPSVLYPTLQLLLSEDTYCMVSLCPFRFLGLRLATPSA